MFKFNLIIINWLSYRFIIDAINYFYIRILCIHLYQKFYIIKSKNKLESLKVLKLY